MNTSTLFAICVTLSIRHGAGADAGQRTAHRCESETGPTVPGGAIAKSLEQEVGAGRGDVHTAQSSIYLVQARSGAGDPARPPGVPAQIHGRAGSGAASECERERRDPRRTTRWAPDSSTAALAATAGLVARRAPAATWSRVPTVAMRRTCSASGSSRCWVTRSRTTCALSALSAIAALPRAHARPGTACRW
jgi:hypothetical protein